MSGQTLADRIAALAAETPDFDGRARVLAVDDATAEHVLDEIDQTVLPAVLTFDAGGATLTLVAGGRRLHEITQASGSLEVPEDLLGKPLSMDEPSLQGAAAQVIRQFAAGAGRLLVMSNPTDAGLIDNPESLSVAALRAALGMGDEDLSQSERFLRRAGESIQGYIQVRDGQVVASDGSSLLTASLKVALTTQLNSFLSTRTQQCGSHSDPSLTLFADVIEPGLGMVLVLLEEDTVIGVARSESFSELQAAFSAIV